MQTAALLRSVYLLLRASRMSNTDWDVETKSITWNFSQASILVSLKKAEDSKLEDDVLCLV